MGWPDIVIAGILVLGALKGFKRGLVSEIGGFIAIAAAFWAAFHYNGAFDSLAAGLTKAGTGSAHIIGMLMYSVAIYIVLMLVSFALGRFVKLPFLGFGNGIAGIPVGIAKAAVLVWAVLYIGLLAPIPNDLRDDLHRSPLVQLELQPNAQIDEALVSTLPWFMRPFVNPFLKGHRV